MNFMRTFEEICEHLRCVSYTKEAIDNVFNFLKLNGHKKEIEEFCISSKIGRSFEDFLDYYYNKGGNVCDDDFQVGDYIHVEDGLDVLALSEVCDRYFVGTNGNIIHSYVLTSESRPCNEEEIEKVITKLEENGLVFCNDCEMLEPIQWYDVKEGDEDNEESLEVKLEKLVDQVDDDIKLLKGQNELLGKFVESLFASTLKKKEHLNGDEYYTSEEIDEIEIYSKNAIENLIATLQEGKITKEERKNIIEAFKALLELGKAYE